MDLFGSAAEEKTVSSITKDVPEAKIQRTYETYRLLGRYISFQYFGRVLLVLKKVFFFKLRSTNCCSTSKNRQYSVVILQSVIYLSFLV